MKSPDAETTAGAAASDPAALAANQPFARRAAICIALILAVSSLGYIDFLSGFEFSFFVFYFLPVGFAAGRLGFLAGLCLAVYSAIVWAVADLSAGHTYSNPIYALWSAMARLTAFLTVAWLVARNSALIERERAIATRLRQSLAQVNLLQGMLPICAACKRIRNASGDWEQMERYIQNHSAAKFSHGYCPECAKNWLQDAGLGEGPAER